MVTTAARVMDLDSARRIVDTLNVGQSEKYRFPVAGAVDCEHDRPLVLVMGYLVLVPYSISESGAYKQEALCP